MSIQSINTNDGHTPQVWCTCAVTWRFTCRSSIVVAYTAFPAHTVEPSHRCNHAFRQSWLNTHTVLCCIHGFSNTYNETVSRYNRAFRQSWLNTHTVLCCIHSFSSTYSGTFSQIQPCFLDKIKYLYHTLSSNNHSSGTSHCKVPGHHLWGVPHYNDAHVYVHFLCMLSPMSRAAAGQLQGRILFETPNTNCSEELE